MSEELTKYEKENKKDLENKKESISKDTVQDQITSLIPLAGTIELTKEQENILYSPVNQDDIEIRPDGLIYLPWMNYVERLRNAFGMSWTLIPYGPPKKLGNFIHWAFWLIIKGRPYGFAVGEQQYFENDRMTYGDALEGAKSNALMRLCKGLGISLELWKPSFVKDWIAKFAETHIDKKGKERWRKKGSKEEMAEKDRVPKQENPLKQEFPSAPGPAPDPGKKESFAESMERERNRLGDDRFFGVLGEYGFERLEEIADREKQIKIYRVITEIK